MLLDHQFDLYSVPLDGGKPVNLTGGVGDAQQIQFRLVRLDRAGGGGRGGRGGGAFGGGAADEDDGVDLTKPLLLSAYGEWTKKSGYYTLAPGGKPTPLIYGDEAIGGAVESGASGSRDLHAADVQRVAGLLVDDQLVRLAGQGDGRESVHRENTRGVRGSWSISRTARVSICRAR